MKYFAIILALIFSLSVYANTGSTVEVIFPCAGGRCSTVFQTVDVGDKVIVLGYSFTVISVGKHTVDISRIHGSATLAGFTRTKFDVDSDGMYDVEISPSIYRQNAVTFKFVKISEPVPNFKKPIVQSITPKVDILQSPPVSKSEVLPETVSQEPEILPVEAEVEIETKVLQQQTRWQTFTSSISGILAGFETKVTITGLMVTLGTVVAGLLIYWLIILVL
ncbi:MAG: hypothetical protein HY363_05570 [Candidatus Aenigmarchaeota archaeon]|nr:hypothetical protein [Candidatus Aenigmarchaeota archaeon]